MLFYRTLRFMQFLFSCIKFIIQHEFVFSQNQREEKPILQDLCASCTFKEDVHVDDDDVNAVMERLDIVIDNECQNNSLIEEANVLLEEKVASEEELREAFEIFDNDRDGFITPNNLWVLMEKLGLGAEMRYEDCEKMIRIYDMNGDGRICFNEFKQMLENTE